MSDTIFKWLKKWLTIEKTDTVTIRKPDHPVFRNSICFWLPNGPIFEWHSKTGLICPVFKRSSFQIIIMKTDTFVRFSNALAAILHLKTGPIRPGLEWSTSLDCFNKEKS
jgi:hypothetical protein